MVGLLKLCDVDLGPSLIRYVALDTKVFQATRQEYVVLRLADQIDAFENGAS
jgi:hypothetical protein